MPRDERPVVEAATQEDVPALADCWVALAREQQAHGSRIRPVANREAILELFRAHVHADGLLVARGHRDELVGFASFTIETGTLELDVRRGLLTNIYVAPAHRGNGIGTKLLRAAESACAERGATVLRLEVMAANEAGRRFYRRHGYDLARVTMERSLDVNGKNDTHSKGGN